MKLFLKIASLVIGFGLIVLFPVLINVCYEWEAPYVTWLEPSKWASFWGTYLAALASFAMVFITWLTLRHYHKQQVFYIKQAEQQKLQSQLDKLYSFQTCINELECLRCLELIKNRNFDGVSKIGQYLIRDFDEKAFAVDISISMQPINSAQNDFHRLYNRIFIEYGTFIQDIIWLNDLIKDMPEKKDDKIAYLNYHLDNYGPITNPNNFICDIIRSYVKEGDIESKLGDIWAAMINNTHIGQDKETLKTVIVAYRDQEVDRISKIN